MKNYTDKSINEYVAELAGGEPVPGGGSAAAVVLSLALALSQMVSEITLRKIQKAKDKKTIKGILKLIKESRKESLELVNIDVRVYKKVIKAYADLKEAKSEKKKKAASKSANIEFENSFRSQISLCTLAVAAKAQNARLKKLVTGAIANDLSVSSEFVTAAFKSASKTAAINIDCMKDAGRAERCRKLLKKMKTRFKQGEIS